MTATCTNPACTQNGVAKDASGLGTDLTIEVDCGDCGQKCALVAT